MATQKKPASTRKPAKRGPTKAAALKALGLTQEDLNMIKELNKIVEEQMPVGFDDRVEPEELTHTESKPELKHPIESTSGTTVPQQWYVRNLRNVEVGIRLERQQGTGKKRLELKPRGERGDIKSLQENDLSDPALLSNIELGVIEVITAAEAKIAIDKQSINEQQRVHPAMAMLRDELGNPATFHGADEYVDRSITVAELNPVGGEYGEIEFDRQNKGSFRRSAPTAESGRQLGGNPHILSDGFAAARAQDEHARRKGIEGPAAGLGGIETVIVEPPKTVVPPKPGE